MQETTWREIVQEHKLAHIPYKDIATWGFGDWVFGQNTDWFSDVNKLRRAGFTAMTIDTTKMFIDQFKQLRQDSIIP